IDTGTALLPEEWQQLNERCFGAHPLLDPRFLMPLIRVYGGSGVWLARLADPSGVAGLALIERASPFRWRLFQPTQAPLGLIMVDQSRVTAEVALRGLLRSVAGLGLI